MKVITEERLKELVAIGLPISFDDLLSECKEIDTLTVSTLRPMCDAPRDRRSILCVLNGSVVFREMYFTEGFWWLVGTDSYFNDGHLQGWVPEVIYKPELAGDGE